jgi:TrpR-related protein YerC/YecD
MSMNPRLKDPDLDNLFAAVLCLESLEECYRFFEDLCTVGELKSLSARLRAAIMLSEGKTYEEIERATKMSTATISRVKRFLHYGADGYKLVLSRLDSGNPTPDKS